jgi:nucleotide-binding universal stress UspA family protein
LHEILKGCPRPAIVVPGTPPAAGPVVVAYDGSAQAARALEAFASSGFMKGQDVHVVALHADEKTAGRWTEVAADYLRSHGYRASGHAERSAGPVGDAILQAVRRHAARLLVMGAYGRSSIREFFFGSVTQRVLRETAVPVLLDH